MPTIEAKETIENARWPKPAPVEDAEQSSTRGNGWRGITPAQKSWLTDGTWSPWVKPPTRPVIPMPFFKKSVHSMRPSLGPHDLFPKRRSATISRREI